MLSPVDGLKLVMYLDSQWATIVFIIDIALEPW